MKAHQPSCPSLHFLQFLRLELPPASPMFGFLFHLKLVFYIKYRFIFHFAPNSPCLPFLLPLRAAVRFSAGLQLPSREERTNCNFDFYVPKSSPYSPHTLLCNDWYNNNNNKINFICHILIQPPGCFVTSSSTLSVNGQSDATAFVLQIFVGFCVLLLISKESAVLGKTHIFVSR